MRRNKPPAFVGRDLRKITDPRYVGRGHGKVAIQHVGRYPQGMSAVGGRDAKLPLAASLNAALSALTLLPIVAYSIQTPRPDAPANELLTQSTLRTTEGRAITGRAIKPSRQWPCSRRGGSPTKRVPSELRSAMASPARPATMACNWS